MSDKTPPALKVRQKTMIGSALIQDLRHALRGFLKSPYAHAERLGILWNRSPGLNILEDWFSTAQYFDIKSGHRGFEQVAIAIGANQNHTGLFEPERIGVLRVVGVVGRVRQYGLDTDGRIALYVPQTQPGARAPYLTVRTAADPAALAAPVKAQIVLAGATIGVVAALALSRVIGSLLFGVAGADPATFMASFMLLGAIALIATFVPARRAARTDPVASLRSE